MAKPRPNTDNRARMVTSGELPTPQAFDPDAHAATVVETIPPVYAVDGNLDLENPVEEAPAQAPEPVTQPAPEPVPEDVDDPRFKGKSKKEIYESYRNLERLKGEKDTEVQTYKTLYEQQVLKPQMEALQKKEQPAPQPTDELSEMLADPVKYRRRIVKEAQEEIYKGLTAAASMSEAQQEWNRNKETFQSPQFAAWEKENLTPQMIQMATQDVRTMKMIVQAFKATQPVQPETPAPDRRLPVGPAMGAPAASKPATTAPTFTTAQLARMQLENPQEYERRQPEILAWYQEQQNKRR